MVYSTPISGAGRSGCLPGAVTERSCIMRFDATRMERIEKVIEPVLTAAGFELVDLVAVVEHGRAILRVFIDRPGGVTIDDCAAMSRELGTVLDVEDVMAGSYSLEVSSPGLDRVLKKERDFERFAGRRVKIRTARPVEGRSNFRATLKGVHEGAVVVVDDSGKEWNISMEDIRRARLVPEF